MEKGIPYQKIIKFLLLGLFYIIFQNSFSQISVKSNVKLINWLFENCDDTYNPYILKDRITFIEASDSITTITVNFSENCCFPVEPTLKFVDNKLYLLPYTTFEGERCDCICCFTITYKISGLNLNKYETYFNGKKVEFSDEYYWASEPKFELYNGKKINKTNKYGFKEGTWMRFYESGAIKILQQYPEEVLYRTSTPIWSKHYYQSGKLDFYHRKDSLERWFEDGRLQSWDYTYTIEDTIYNEVFSLYDNHQVKKRYKDKSYVLKDESALYHFKITTKNILLQEEYYENGLKKILFTKDTIFSWYESGILKTKENKSREFEYDQNGRLLRRVIHWSKIISGFKNNFNHSLYIDYFQNGQIKTIEYVRDEPTLESKSISIGHRYNWKWNEDGKCIEYPPDWNEKLPWKDIDEIKPPKISIKR